MQNNVIMEWGSCLPDCPSEAIVAMCRTEPDFPPFADGISNATNFTVYYEYPTTDVTSI
jgi:hypothetical protein